MLTVNKLDEDSLGKIIWKYGEERLYKKIAHGIVYFRNSHGPIKTTQQLADIIGTIVKQLVSCSKSYSKYYLCPKNRKINISIFFLSDIFLYLGNIFIFLGLNYKLKL